MTYALLLVALLLRAYGARALSASSCTVRVEGGLARGYVREAERGAAYLSFRGLPYARQPLAALRFQPPEPVEPWEGVLDARDEGPSCPQHDALYGALRKPQGSAEGCLHANVHVPLAAARPAAELQPPRAPDHTEDPLPVLVFVHGGGFNFGSGDADVNGPEYLVTKGVIVVTFNYRVGILGFLSLGTRAVPGNAGLRDQLAALRWVRRNIRAFGGDPDNVTLGGQSAGAASAHLLALSPAARGLFKRVIAMSGAGFRSFFSSSPVHAQRVAARLLRELNVTSTDPAEQARALQATPVDALVAAQAALQGEEGLAVFAPVVETPHEGLEPVLPEDPYALAAVPRAPALPMIVGYTSVECETFVPQFENMNILDIIGTVPAALLPPALLYASTPERLASASEAVRRRYFSDGLTMRNYVRYCTDASFAYPAQKAAALALEAGAEARVYRFAYGGGYDVLQRALGRRWAGAAHLDDLFYVLRPNSFTDAHAPGSADEWVRDWMTALFTNFMKVGSPTPALPGARLDWPPAEPPARPYLSVDSDIAVLERADDDLLEFFDRLYDQ